MLRKSFVYRQPKIYKNLIATLVLTALAIPCFFPVGVASAKVRQGTVAQKYHLQAARFQKQKKYKEAIQYAAGAARLYGKGSTSLANCYEIIYKSNMALKKYTDAQKALQVLATLKPNSKTLILERASLYFLQNKPDLAEKDLKHALNTISPKDKAYEMVGLRYSKHKKTKKAFECYKKAFELNPKRTVSAVGLASRYDEQGKYDIGINILTKALEFQPNDIYLHILRSSAYETTGDYYKSIDDLTSLLKQNPNNYKFNGKRARLYSIVGEHEKAIADIKNYLKWQTQPSAWQLLIKQYKMLGDFDKAFKTIQESKVSKDTKYDFTTDYYEDLMKPDKALKIIEQAIKEYPKDNSYLRLKAMFLANNLDYENALLPIDKFIKLEPKRSIGQIIRGNILTKSGKFDEAEATFKKSIALYPKSKDGYDYLTRFYRFRGQPDKAIETYKTLTQAIPTGEYFDDMADLYDELGKVKEADACHKKAIQLSPKDYSLPLNYAEFLYKTKAPKEQVTKYLELGKKLASNKADHQGWVSYSFSECDRYEEAIAIADQAFKKYNNSILLRRKANALWSMGKVKEALEVAKECCSKLPYKDSHFYTLGWMADELGETSVAIEAYKQASKLDPEDCTYLNNLAKATLLSGDKEEARKLLNKSREIAEYALRLNIPTAYRMKTLAITHCLLGQFDEAKKYANLAIKINPSSSGAYYCLAIAQENQGNTDNAIKNYTKAIDMFETYTKAIIRRAFLFKKLGKEELAKADWKNLSDAGVNVDFWQSKSDALCLKADQEKNSE